MQMSGTKLALGIGGGILGAFFIMYLVVWAIGSGATGSVTGDGLINVETVSKVGFEKISAVDVNFDFDSEDSSAQDATADVDIDTFYYTVEANAKALADGQIDCSMATPVEWDGVNNIVEVPDSALCKINPYKFWQDSNYNAGNSETKLDDNFVVQKADVTHKDDASEISQAPTGVDLVATVVENSTTDNDDLIPFAFRFKLATTTNQERDEISNGNLAVTFRRLYQSDAVANSKTQLEGSCSDSEGKSKTLDSNLDGAINSIHTSTVSSFKLECDSRVKVNEKGYAIILENPLAQTDTEKSYLLADVYGRYSNDTTPERDSTITWTVMNGSSVKFDTTDDIPAYQYTMIWEGSTACGKTLSSTSTTDALDLASEKMYGLGCLVDAKGEGATVTIPTVIYGAKAKYASANSTDNILETAESLIDITIVGMETTTDIMGADLDA